MYSELLRFHGSKVTNTCMKCGVRPLQGVEAQHFLHMSLSLDVSAADGVSLQARQRQHIEVIQHRPERS